jgi:putative NIF3 family GTP cyclohydrolase 1 type 2
MTARNVVHFIEDQVPQLSGEEGFQYGDPEAEVAGVVICWMATVPALRFAADHGCNLVIAHEATFQPDDSQRQYEWVPNRARREILDAHRIALFRSHWSADTICIFDEFARLLGLGEVSRGEGFYRVFAIEPTTVRRLADRAKQAMGLETIRVAGDLDKVVSRVGLAWGGLGLYSNVGFLQKILENGADVAIGGESDDIAMRFALDSDLPFIETGHSVSENPGLRILSQQLAGAFPRLKVLFFENPLPYRWL